ncbi:hypothetical protein DRE_04529 [Drechslerella stenobrocha 248]|uniref:Uncharacterized protein n=1 Tax=Drechslerella stenobrocha 248 TaxID=1043628 RepID=W7HPU3_9PEZI|nr:hypothetical protein DRE_04529 [Drechslerella stenobrocha 248]
MVSNYSQPPAVDIQTEYQQPFDIGNYTANLSPSEHDGQHGDTLVPTLTEHTQGPIISNDPQTPILDEHSPTHTPGSCHHIASIGRDPHTHHPEENIVPSTNNCHEDPFMDSLYARMQDDHVLASPNGYHHIPVMRMESRNAIPNEHGIPSPDYHPHANASLIAGDPRGYARGDTLMPNEHVRASANGDPSRLMNGSPQGFVNSAYLIGEGPRRPVPAARRVQVLPLYCIASRVEITLAVRGIGLHSIKGWQGYDARQRRMEHLRHVLTVEEGDYYMHDLLAGVWHDYGAGMAFPSGEGFAYFYQYGQKITESPIHESDWASTLDSLFRHGNTGVVWVEMVRQLTL